MAFEGSKQQQKQFLSKLLNFFTVGVRIISQIPSVNVCCIICSELELVLEETTKEMTQFCFVFKNVHERISCITYDAERRIRCQLHPRCFNAHRQIYIN